MIGGLAETGILYVRWASGLELYHGPGSLAELPSEMRALLALLFPDNATALAAP